MPARRLRADRRRGQPRRIWRWSSSALKSASQKQSDRSWARLREVRPLCAPTSVESGTHARPKLAAAPRAPAWSRSTRLHAGGARQEGGAADAGRERTVRGDVRCWHCQSAQAHLGGVRRCGVGRLAGAHVLAGGTRPFLESVDALVSACLALAGLGASKGGVRAARSSGGSVSTTSPRSSPPAPSCRGRGRPCGYRRSGHRLDRVPARSSVVPAAIRLSRGAALELSRASERVRRGNVPWTVRAASHASPTQATDDRRSPISSKCLLQARLAAPTESHPTVS